MRFQGIGSGMCIEDKEAAMKKKFEEYKEKVGKAKDLLFSWKGALLLGGGIYVIWSSVKAVVYLTRFLDKIIIVVVTAAAIYFFYKWKTAPVRVVTTAGETMEGE